MPKHIGIHDIPKDVLNAARKVEHYFAVNNIKTWSLMGVCSRDHATQLEQVEAWMSNQIIAFADVRVRIHKMECPDGE